MITRITLENFKGIGEATSIELRPLTLLFGKNSSGKSTVLHALAYAREIFEHHQCDAFKTTLGGESLDLGGFPEIVHQHDLSRKIRLRFDLDLGNFSFRNDTEASEDLVETINSVLDETETGWIEMEIGSSGIHLGEDDGIRVLSYTVCLGDNFRAKISCSSRKQNQFLHSKRDLKEDHGTLDRWGRSRFRGVLSEIAFTTSWKERFGFLEDIITEIGDLDEEETDDEIERDSLASGQKYAYFLEQSDAFPFLDYCRVVFPNDAHEMPSDLRDESLRNARFLIDQLIYEPGRYLASLLFDMVYIGPIRQVPSRNMERSNLSGGNIPLKSRDVSRWATGLAAWDELLDLADGCHSKKPSEELSHINHWLSDPKKLDTGYVVLSLKGKLLTDINWEMMKKNVDLKPPFAEKEVSVPADGKFDNRNSVSDWQSNWEKWPQKTWVGLRDLRRNVDLQLHSVGVGLSQLIPVVVGLVKQEYFSYLIEQPELHLHPAQQAAVGDLLIHAAVGGRGTTRRKLVIAETHSIHLVLRILKRIRETYEKKTVEFEFNNDDLSIQYADMENNETCFYRLEVSEKGKLRQPWPDSFFDQEFYEKFDDDIEGFDSIKELDEAIKKELRS